MADRLVVDLDARPLTWPLGDDALEDLRWYLEDYLSAPFGVYGDRGGRIEALLADWGRAVYQAVFGSDMVQGDVQLVLRSASPSLLALPWELMVAPGRAAPLALELAEVSRSLPVTDDAETVPVPGGQLRVLMVISRPAGTGDVGYRMIARPLLARLAAVRGAVDVAVLRPPTLDALRSELEAAAVAGEPYQVVHFDGHGMMIAGESVLVFEKARGCGHAVPAAEIAKVLGDARVPVVVLNACQSGAVGKDLEAAVATALLRDGAASVVAMAYSVYAVAAAEFMAAFYECLFTGGTVGSAVTAGRRQLYRTPGRPSPKGDLPLADWLVPVHYLRRQVSFPHAIVSRPTGLPALADALAELPRTAGGAGAGDLDAVDGVFVGRDALFYDLEAAARLQKVVVLAGPGGAGKTELAKAFGRWWRDTGGVARPDWVFWHSFEPGVSSFGLDGVITDIGLALHGPRFARLDGQTRRTVVQKALTEDRMLLLWDNFESVREMPGPGRATPPLDDAGCAEIRRFLAHLAAHGKSAVVITSRTREDWLGPACRITVGGLTTGEAAEYTDVLLAFCPAAQQRREQQSFGELLEWLDGHPLAMRLTLPLLDSADPADLLAGLRGTAPPPGGDAGEGRLSSLGACLTYSFAHLPEQARRLLPALSLLHGVADASILTVFSAEIAQGRFAGTGKQKWSAVLADAARVGLLTSMGRGLYRIHPALPGYLTAGWHAGNPDGYEQERGAAEEALRAACAAFSQWAAGQIRSGDASLAYTLIALHRRTLGAMLGHALERHAWDDAENIARALNGYWVTRGLSGEADAWAGRILEATARPGQPPARPARSLWLDTSIEHANRQYRAGQLDQAGQTCRQVLTYLQEQPEIKWARPGVSFIYHLLGAIAQDHGRLDEAEQWYRQSLAIKEKLGNRRGMAGTYHQLGTAAQDAGRLDEAEQWYRQSLAINEEIGNRPDMSITYHQLGNTAYLRGRLDEAEQWYRKSLAVKEKLGDRRGMAGTYHQLGTAAQDAGRLDEAEQWYRQSLTIKEELGDSPGRALTYHCLGVIAFRRGRLHEAEDWCRQSLTINEELGNLPGAALTYGQLGLIAEAREQPHQALEWTVRCVALFAEQVPHPATGPGPAHLARLARQLGMPALEDVWQQVTGQPVPQPIRDYVTGHHDEKTRSVS